MREVMVCLPIRADVPYVNLGFSGQARLDLVMADVMACADASLYLVDPVWNCDETLKADPVLAGKIHYLSCTGMLPDDGEATHGLCDEVHGNDRR